MRRRPMHSCSRVRAPVRIADSTNNRARSARARIGRRTTRPAGQRMQQKRQRWQPQNPDPLRAAVASHLRCRPPLSYRLAWLLLFFSPLSCLRAAVAVAARGAQRSRRQWKREASCASMRDGRGKDGERAICRYKLRAAVSSAHHPHPLDAWDTTGRRSWVACLLRPSFAVTRLLSAGVHCAQTATVRMRRVDSICRRCAALRTSAPIVCVVLPHCAVLSCGARGVCGAARGGRARCAQRRGRMRSARLVASLATLAAVAARRSPATPRTASRATQRAADDTSSRREHRRGRTETGQHNTKRKQHDDGQWDCAHSSHRRHAGACAQQVVIERCARRIIRNAVKAG